MRKLTLLNLLAVLVLLLAACGPAATEAPPPEAEAPEAEVLDEVIDVYQDAAHY